MTNAVIGALRVNLGIDSAQFQNGLRNAQGALARFGSMAKGGLVAAAAAAGAAIGALGASVKSTIDAADEMSKAAQKIGVPIEELSRLKYAADLAGVSFDGLQTAVGKLSRVMNDAKSGSKSALDTFDQIGVSATNADGSLKSASQVLAEISDKFAKMPDGAEKTALAMELMGRSGANMIPLLNGGAEALAKLMGEADTFGQVFSTEMGANAEAFNDNITRMQGVFANISAQVATALLPHLVEFSNWLVANGPQIAAVTTALIGAAVAVVKFGADIVNLGITIATFLSGAWAQFEAAWDGIVLSVNGMKDQVIAAVTQMTADLVALLVSLKDRAIAAVAEMVTGITDWLGNKLKAAFDGVKGSVEGMLSYFQWGADEAVHHSIIPDMVMAIGEWMGRLDENMVQPAAQAAQGVNDAFSGIGDSIGSMFSGFGSSIAGAIKGTQDWSDVLSGLLSKLGDNLLQTAFAGFGGGGGGGIGDLFSGLLGGLFGFANGGSFKVGGAGGIDSQVVAFRASPNERVDVSKPGQHMGAGGRSVVELKLSPDLQARILEEANANSVRISRSTIKSYDKTALPGSAQRISRDKRAR